MIHFNRFSPHTLFLLLWILLGSQHLAFGQALLFSTISGIPPLAITTNSQNYLDPILDGYFNAVADDFTVPAGDLWGIQELNDYGLKVHRFGAKAPPWTDHGLKAAVLKVRSFDYNALRALKRAGTVKVIGNYFSTVGGMEGPAESVNVYILRDSDGFPDTDNLSDGYAAEGIAYTDSRLRGFYIALTRIWSKSAGWRLLARGTN